MQIFWPACFSFFRVWMVTLSGTVHLLRGWALRGAAIGRTPSRSAGSPSATSEHNRGSAPLAGQRNVVLRPGAVLADHLHQVFQVCLAVHVVDLRSVDHQERRVGVMEEEVVVGVTELLEV